MPASLPPRKAPPARRITQSSSIPPPSSVPSPPQPPSSSPRSTANTPANPSQPPPPQPTPAPRHAHPARIPRFPYPTQMTNVSQPQSSDIKPHMSAPQQQHVPPQSQQPQTSQQPIIHSPFVSQPLPTTSHPSTIPHQHQPQHQRTPTDHPPSNTPITSGQLVAVTMGLNTNNIPHPQSTATTAAAAAAAAAAAVQYPNPAYPNPAFFDQFNIASSIPLSMSPANPAVTVVRDIDRQPHTNTPPHVNPRTPPHPIPKSSDVQYSDHPHQTHHLQNQHNIQQPQHTAQQHILHRPPAIHAHAQQDIHPHPIPPHHIHHHLYQPLDPQQNPQHLVMNQPTQFVQQTQPAIHNHTSHLQQPSHMPSQDPSSHFDPHTYQITHQTQLANVNNMALQQTGDLHARKTVNAATQTDLLTWNPAPQGRVVTAPMGPQPPPEINNAIAPATLINPSAFPSSHIFEMGMPDIRHQSSQNSLALQQVQPQKVQRTQSTTAPSNPRKTPNQATDISPRKRRQTNSRAPQTVSPPAAAVTPGRTFSCSGCGQDFAQKRDRDNHVRTVHERSFSCSKCTSRFKTKSDANRHVRIVHDRVRPYSCPSCPSMFSERNKLRRHRETVHEKLRPFGCPVCPARFGELGNLRQHTSSLHPETTIDNAQIRSRAAQAAASPTAGVNSQIQS